VTISAGLSLLTWRLTG